MYLKLYITYILIIIIMLNIKTLDIFLHSSRKLSPLNLLTLSYIFSNQVSTKINKNIVLSKKRHKQLMELKKQLSKKQPIKSQNLYQQYHYRDIYKRINTKMQSFFYQRPYTLQNFNFLINLIGEQTPTDLQQKISQVIHKMQLLQIQPNQKTYNYMIKAAANIKQIKLAQQYFKQACKKFLPNKYFYTSLMQAYVNIQDANMALKILDEMIQQKLQPDLPTYTTLINCFRKSRKLEKCWQVHRKLIKTNKQLDQTYVGVMIKVYAATHDAQKAIKMYRQHITQKGVKPMIQTINSYFKALSSRRQYSNVVVDKFFQLIEKGDIVTTQTANWALRACSTIGNIRSAGQILKLMKVKQIQINKATLTILLKVYGTACLVPGQDEKLRDIIITDSWKLLQQIQKMGQVSTDVLNNMLTIYANSINLQQIDGLILPLYDKFKQPYNMYTFQILMELYYKTNQFTTAQRIWNIMTEQIRQNQLVYQEKYGNVAQHQLKINKLNEELRPTFNALHAYLDIGIKLMDMNKVIQALDMFKKYKRMPKNQTLKFLGNLKNLPQQITAALVQFKIQFGKAKISKKNLPNIQDPQNK